jgi:hypothetical protein
MIDNESHTVLLAHPFSAFMGRRWPRSLLNWEADSALRNTAADRSYRDDVHIQA